MFQRLDEIKNYLYSYIEARIELFKTETQEGLEKTVIHLIYAGIAFSMGLICAVFLLIVIAALLNQWLDSHYAGFLIVFGFFFFLLMGWLFFKTKIYQIIRQKAYSAFRKMK
jgi:uncharacterized membrane protein YqjE